MALLAVAADKGSPGVTTTALSLAAVWPRRCVLAELDPFGGDVAYRLRGPRGAPLSPATGLITLAVDARRGGSPERLLEHVQRLDGGLDVLLGLASGDQAGGMTGLWGPVASLLDQAPELDVVADCGRLYSQAPTVEVLRHASAVLLVTRPTLDGVVHLRARLATLAAELRSGAPDGVPLHVAVLSAPRDERSTEEIGMVLRAAHLPVTVVGRIAYDPAGAGMITGEWLGRLDRSLLIRSARQVATRLAQTLAVRVGG
ncbi:MAG: hypothetical protein HYR62_09355 [Actinobacteria bacterium]|nr:hypothetical protein [Actinomycetota bacterium]MBI3688038.1 hypothetical protein [Actinomycetota bacterium]